MAFVLFGLFFILVFLNVPIAVALGLSSILVLALSASFGIPLPLEMFPNLMYSGIGKFALLAIPYFIMAGLIMEYAGISKRLIRFASACIGHTNSGLIIVVVAVSCFFAAISGSGPATVAALGAILIPAMVSAGYNKGLSTALMSSSGAIGIIIPPSILYVVYASIADVSVGKIFAGGLFPGILLGAAFVFAAMYGSRKDSITKQPKASAKERWDAFKDAVWGLLTPVVILGGIYGGVFTPTESAGVAIIYGLFVGIFIYKEINLKNISKLFVDAAVMSATVMYIIACASVFAWLLTTSHIATDVSEALLAFSGNNPIILLIIVNIIFLIAGCFLDANSACYILVPVLLPVCKQLGIDPIHFGVFMTVNLAIGLVTPPVGVNLYVGASILNIPVIDVIRKIIPFVIAGIIALIIITYIPQLTMFMANLAGGGR
ncbi:MAG: TRAP transporter large permease [Elusimicrobiota bacterium]|jgi:C4-dicarboxylate transporter DctM subunit|nr:TRAP transporter large permease [Elusimicrobiota bacterium]